MTVQNDPYTGEVFTPLRSNQKFANRRNQIAFNNQIARDNRRIKSPILTVLNTNHKVLINILGNKEFVVKSKDFLLGAGFNFSIFSRSIRTNDGIYQAIYDYAISAREGDVYKIVKL